MVADVPNPEWYGELAAIIVCEGTFDSPDPQGRPRPLRESGPSSLMRSSSKLGPWLLPIPGYVTLLMLRDALLPLPGPLPFRSFPPSLSPGVGSLDQRGGPPTVPPVFGAA